MSLFAQRAAGILTKPAPVGGVPTLVKDPDSDFSNASTSFSVPVSGSTAGSTLVLGTLRYDRDDVTYNTPTDDRGGSWTIFLQRQSTAGQSTSSFCWAYCDNCPEGVTSVSVSTPAGSFGGQVSWVWEITEGVITAADTFENTFTNVFHNAEAAGISGGAGVYMTQGWFNSNQTTWSEPAGWSSFMNPAQSLRQHAAYINSAGALSGERGTYTLTSNNNRGSGMIAVVN